MPDHPETASQTAGPYVHIGCTPNVAGINGVYSEDIGTHMISEGAAGTRITLRGQIFDGAGAPLCDALVEAWQADAGGLYPGMTGADPHFTGFGRCPCDPDTGVFRFETIKPGPVAGPDGSLQAPHITLWIVARGINLGLHTRVYFADEPGNASDPLITQIGNETRVGTLMALAEDHFTYRFNIHLQGTDETVFLDI